MNIIGQSLRGKSALVTGGSRGIGRAIALGLASQGANVVIGYFKNDGHAREVVKAITDAGGKAVAALRSVKITCRKHEGARWPQSRRVALAVVLCTILPTVTRSEETAGSPSAAERMNEPGPEARELAGRVGTWDVIATFWPTPDAAPIVTTGLIAERKMIGLFLEEVIRPAPGSNTRDFRRLAYLTFNRVEGRWQYVSIDTRLPVGIMPAWSFAKEVNGRLTLQFEPLAFVGMGKEVGGRMLRSNLVLVRESDHREKAQQYWITSDGTERQWLAVQYEYIRKE